MTQALKTVVFQFDIRYVAKLTDKVYCICYNTDN